MKIALKIISLLAMLSFSANAQAYVAEASVVIDAPLRDVWVYNSNNENAREWSVYFAKIVTCPVEDCAENYLHTPGQVGGVRRCYRNENEKGVFWDEKNLEIALNNDSAYRRILAYNFNGYHWDVMQENIELVVEQFYKSLGPEQTKLTFRSTLNPMSELSTQKDKGTYNDIKGWEYKLFDFIYTYVSGPQTTKLFEENLANIKAAIEQGESYQRIYHYKKVCNASNWYCPQWLSDL